MAYVTKAQLIERFGADELVRLTDRDGSAGAIVDSVLDAAIADAGSEADAYVGARYLLPLSSVPDALVRVAADLVRYRLYDDAAPEQVRKRYEDAVRFLAALAKGAISIGMAPAGAPGSSGDARVQSGGRVFGRDDNSFL